MAQYFAETLSGHTDSSTDELKACLIAQKVRDTGGIIIGDTEADVLAGKRLSLVTIAVASGIRSRQYLQALEPDYLIDSIVALPGILGDSAYSAPRAPRR